MLEKCIPISMTCPAAIVPYTFDAVDELRTLPRSWNLGWQAAQSVCDLQMPTAARNNSLLLPKVDVWKAVTMPCADALLIPPGFVRNASDIKLEPGDSITHRCVACIGLWVPCLSQAEHRKANSEYYKYLRETSDTALYVSEHLAYYQPGVFALLSCMFACYFHYTRGDLVSRGDYTQVSTNEQEVDDDLDPEPVNNHVLSVN